jgi:hypothetical protein
MPTETFKSKVDTWLVLVLEAASLMAVVGVVFATRSGDLPIAVAVATGLFAAGIPAWIMVTTRYHLSPDSLIVRSGPFRWNIPLADIRAVTPTRSALSSPALSLDRLRIEYGQGRSVMISPSDKAAFLRALEAKNNTAIRR